jgi:hypothetical protein
MAASTRRGAAAVQDTAAVSFSGGAASFSRLDGAAQGQRPPLLPGEVRRPKDDTLLLWRSGIYEAEAVEAATATATAERRADGGAHSARLACGFF